MPEITWVGSPNFYPGRVDKNGVTHKPLVIVNHIECGTEDGTTSWFKNPASQVSSNFGVARDGTIHQFVKVSDAAWANGGLNNPDQAWLNQFPAVNPNYWTVSIEHEGYPSDGLTEQQYQSTLWLHKYIHEQTGIPLDEEHVVGHFKFDSVTRKDCPGPKFPWDRLLNDLRKGGSMQTLKLGSTGDDVKTLQTDLNLQPFNPKLVVDGVFGHLTDNAVRVFQNAHFGPSGVDGIVGPLTWAALEATAAPAPQPQPTPAPQPTPQPTPEPTPTPEPILGPIVHNKVLAVWNIDTWNSAFFLDVPIKTDDPTVKSVGKMQFDTGAFTICLSKDMAEFLKLPNEGPMQIQGIGGTVDAYKSTLTAVVGDKEIPMPIVCDQWTDINTVGLFGMKGLIDNGIGIDIDEVAGTITLYDATGDKKGA